MGGVARPVRLPQLALDSATPRPGHEAGGLLRALCGHGHRDELFERECEARRTSRDQQLSRLNPVATE